MDSVIHHFCTSYKCSLNLRFLSFGSSHQPQYSSSQQTPSWTHNFSLFIPSNNWQIKTFSHIILSCLSPRLPCHSWLTFNSYQNLNSNLIPNLNDLVSEALAVAKCRYQIKWNSSRHLIKRRKKNVARKCQQSSHYNWIKLWYEEQRI